MGNYGMNLANTMLNYDLGTRGAAANLRNQTIQGWFELLIADKTAQGNVAAAQAGVGGAGGSTTSGYNPNNPNHNPYDLRTWLNP